MIIFVFGEEQFLARDHVKKMRDRFAEKYDASGMNSAEFSAATEKGVMMQAIQSPPFLGEKRFVIIRGLLESLKAKEAKEWAKLLDHVPESTILVLVDALSEKQIKKHALFKAFEGEEQVHTYHFPLMEYGKRQAWAAQYAQEIQLSIPPALLARVIGLVGDDTWQLSLELKKLAAFANGSTVDENMIQALVQANFSDQMFAFMDALSQRSQEKALALLEEQRGAGSSDFHLLSMLAREVRLLLAARDLIEGNPSVSKQELANVMKIHPFVAQKTLSHARAFTGDHLRIMHRLLFHLDRGLKSGQVDVSVAVDRAVLEMVVKA